MNSHKYKKIHFVGIGGIGMSALARYYMSTGAAISGSDGNDSEIVQDLIVEGAHINIGHQENNVPDDIDLLIYTTAISSDNPELLKGISLNNEEKCKVLTYPQALGEMSQDKKVISVSGTHGKTTTTAMAFEALSNAGFHPSMILGSLIDYKGKKTNYVYGESDWIIIESCEYRKSFMNYNPLIIIITNIEADHLDYYKDLKDIQDSFQGFVDKLPSGGVLICHQNEYNIMNFDRGQKIDVDTLIDVKDIKLSVPGQHNKENAKLVISLGKSLGLDQNKIKEGLFNFAGTWRRQENKDIHYDMQCYDDYAHHPSEIKATLQAFREKYPSKKIIAAFMPHLYSRTKAFFEDFVLSFDQADEVVVLPIFAAREKIDTSISSDMLVREIANRGKKAVFLSSIESLKDYMSIHGNSDTIFITMGAGDVYKVYEK